MFSKIHTVPYHHTITNFIAQSTTHQCNSLYISRHIEDNKKQC